MAQYNSLVASLNTPYVVEYTASWCGPCKTVDALADNMEREYNGKWTLIRIDID
jgi:putative thioredoxin